MKMTAHQVVELLASKHAKDVFVPECKVGPTQSYGSNLIRLDAWAMAKSWAKPTTWGYEIKVSRGDFLSDTKWRQYLDFCSEFYFVCPAQLILPEELPADVGLLWISTTGTKLYTKKKAPTRDVQVPEDLFRYILMWRARVGGDGRTVDDRLADWRHWLAEREERRRLASQIRGAIREAFQQNEREREALKKRLEDFEHIEQRLQQLGFDPHGHISTWAVEKKAVEIVGRDARWARKKVDEAVRTLQRCQHELADMEAQESDA